MTIFHIQPRTLLRLLRAASKNASERNFVDVSGHLAALFLNEAFQCFGRDNFDVFIVFMLVCKDSGDGVIVYNDRMSYYQRVAPIEARS